MTTRDATTRWTGGLQDGKGEVSLDSSNLGQFTISLPHRVGDADGQTSPEELIAAAHSGCLAMNMSGTLGAAGYTATSIDVSAEVTFGQRDGAPAITGIALTMRAAVPGLDADKFAELAATAERTCPVSKALAGTTITLDATLE
jgi:osmotically inducible protein OsmC